MRGWVRLALLAPVLGACAVTEVPAPQSSISQNQCESDADCPGGRCGDGACVAGSSTLTSLLVEVTPPASFGVLPSVPFYTTLGTNSKLCKHIVLDPIVHLTGTVTLDPSDCTPHFVDPEDSERLIDPIDGSIPVQVSFSPSTRTRGLPTQTYRSHVVSPGAMPSGKHGFDIQVPPGDYDLYIEPFATQDTACQIPPRLLLKQHVAASGPLDIKLAAPSALTVPVHWPTGSLGDWTVELVDPISGRVLSAPAALRDPPSDEPSGALYQATLSYSHVFAYNSMGRLAPIDDGSEIVRLRPPADRVAPTILGQLSAVGVVAGTAGGIALTTPLPANVRLEGQTAEAGTTRPVSAAVTLVATRIDGMDQQVFGSFSRTVQVGTDGLFSEVIPPGEYLVDAIPKVDSLSCGEAGCSRLAAVRTTWTVGASPDVQAGKLLEFPFAASVNGDAVSSSGGSVAGAAVRATASPFTLPDDVWNAADGRFDVSPRGGAGLVRADGLFDLYADSGTFDFFVQPDPSTRFGWYVRPLLKVDSNVHLRRVTLPLPLVHRGRVQVGGACDDATQQTVVPNALIRAYVFLTPEGQYSAVAPSDGAVIQVAETRADDSGTFELLIPASLDSPELPSP